MNETKLLKAIHKAQEQYINKTKASELFDDMLSALLELTDSEYGFIGEIKYPDEGDPFLKTHALTNIAWNDETRDFYEKNAPFGLEFSNLNTLFGHVISTGEVVIANTPATDKRAGGLPIGHPPLDHFLGLPFHIGDKFVGMVGISNKKGGYTESIVEFLKPLMSTCAQLIEAFRLDRKNKSMLEELVEMKNHAESANMAKSEFLANMNHEIRTPLHGILGTAELIEEYIGFKYEEDEKLKEFIGNIISSSKHLGSIVTDTLDLAKIESGSMTLDNERFELNKTVQEVLELLSNFAEEYENKLTYQTFHKEVYIESDEKIVKQILINLISNAIKFTSKGQVSVSVEQIDKTNGPHIIFRVADDGIGIEESDQVKIFEAFSQVDITSTKKHQGTGLGLNITKRFIDLMGGSMELTSQITKGSTFTVFLPIKG
jgi:signal transduction histidine kinase